MRGASVSVCALVVVLAVAVAVVEALPSMPWVPGFVQRQSRKQLAGPPSEFESMDLPTGDDVEVGESSALLVVDLVSIGPCERDSHFVYSGLTSLPVDSASLFRLTLMHRPDSSLVLSSVSLTSENRSIALPLAVVEVWPLGDSPGPSSMGGEGNEHLVAVTWSFPSPTVGVWSLSFSIEEKNATANGLHRVALILYNENPDVVLEVSVNSLGLHTGEECGLQAQLSDSEMADAAIVSGQVHFTLPDGTTAIVPMTRDGDLWSGTMVCTQGGSYLSQAMVEGLTASNVPFIRSAQVPFSVVDDAIKITGEAAAFEMTSKRISLHIAVSGPSPHRYRAYAEVYGHTQAHTNTSSVSPSVVAVAWISSIVDIESPHSLEGLSAAFSSPLQALSAAAFEHFYVMELDMDWLSLAGAEGPLVLRNVVLQNADSGVEVTSNFADIVVPLSPSLSLLLQTHLQSRSGTQVEITEEMREGIRPVSLSASSREGDSIPMVFVHGYCAGDNPWERDKAIWGADAHYFKDLNANRGNDEFARRIKDFMESKMIANDPVAILGHSQGGMAIAHLYNYYWTGLNIPRNGKALQAVGTPWQGCSMAGNTAALGSVFGVGCGTNYDLTPSGAASWLPGITSSTRQAISYYQTTYKQGTLLGDYCNLAANSVLSFPNDGTTEQKYARLPSATFMGETQEQCHVTGMKYPAQYHDSSRNLKIKEDAQP